MNVELILPAMLIPENTEIRKINGAVKYTLKKSIKVYANDPAIRQEIKGDDVVFLVSSGGTINAHAATDKFVVEMLLDDTLDFLTDLAMSSQ